MITLANKPKGGEYMSITTKIVADVDPTIKDLLEQIKKPNESTKAVIVRLIEQEHKKMTNNIRR